jgi:hypothetical protein
MRLTAKGRKSFKQYALSRRAAADHITGGFIREAKSDTELPDIKTWRELRAYLHGRGATDQMYVAARQVWRDYQRAFP